MTLRSRPAVVLWVALTAVCGALLTGCGASRQGPTSSVSLGQIEAQHRDALVAARIRRLRRQLAQRRRAASAPAAAAPESGPGAEPAAGAPRPQIVQKPIPFPQARKDQMAAYAQRHYGIDSYALRDPKVIVEHYTVTSNAQAAYNTFAPDVPDSELHELPGTCAHFVIDTDGTIYQLVPLTIMCRHTVGLNYTSIGIEHAGFSDRQILDNPRELQASLALTRWLRCRYGIAISNVIGHNESLTSPYHRELVASLRGQTHGDWTRADMDVYRAKLARLGCG